MIDTKIDSDIIQSTTGNIMNESKMESLINNLKKELENALEKKRKYDDANKQFEEILSKLPPLHFTRAKR